MPGQLFVEPYGYGVRQVDQAAPLQPMRRGPAPLRSPQISQVIYHRESISWLIFSLMSLATLLCPGELVPEPARLQPTGQSLRGRGSRKHPRHVPQQSAFVACFYNLAPFSPCSETASMSCLQVGYSLSKLASSQPGKSRKDLDPADISAMYHSIQQLQWLVPLAVTDAGLSLGLMFRLSVLPLTRRLTCLSRNLWSKTLQVSLVLLLLFLSSPLALLLCHFCQSLHGGA
jgi:hypothetical protein